MTAIESRGVAKEFGADDVVRGADLAVEEGEVLLLMGPNGVGKTVLLSCLAGSREPTEGAVEVFGRPVGEDGGDSLTFLLQDSMAVETLTGRENVDFYSRLHHRFTDRWREYVDRLGLTDDLDKRVEHYSEGMKRKLELALTMGVDVPVYLLDEPTAGVDLTNIQRFHDIILEARDAGKTVLVSSHRPIDANIADRVAFMPDGTVSTVGEPDGLMEQVPTVVRVTGSEAMRTAEEYVDGQLFPVGGEARGFLAEDVAFEDLAGAVESGGVERIDPTYTDLFNYYIHVEP
ncbi:ABC transporter ATP-binding protein [Salinirussus salinus]|uniref:ABC transporter ATP-binding protein n=1 Tax=Salinirussus salinus TaxID=1198300 RepID=UPI001356741B|nr:ABC transporter ATP-binding protein [Salinirussus salinus]